jgi:hypothetical protein
MSVWKNNGGLEVQTAIAEYIALIQRACSCWRLVYDVPTHLLSEGTHDSSQKINKPASYNGKVQVAENTVALRSREASKVESIKTWLCRASWWEIKACTCVGDVTWGVIILHRTREINRQQTFITFYSGQLTKKFQPFTFSFWSDNFNDQFTQEHKYFLNLSRMNKYLYLPSITWQINSINGFYLTFLSIFIKVLIN